MLLLFIVYRVGCWYVIIYTHLQCFSSRFSHSQNATTVLVKKRNHFKYTHFIRIKIIIIITINIQLVPEKRFTPIYKMHFNSISKTFIWKVNYTHFQNDFLSTILTRTFSLIFFISFSLASPCSQNKYTTYVICLKIYVVHIESVEKPFYAL